MLKATRPLAAPTTMEIDGQEIAFIDGWHAKLFEYGRHLQDRGINKRMRDPLWRHFAGYVEDQPEAAAPFAKPHHVDFLALHVFDDVDRHAWRPENLIIDGDRQFDYFQRNIRALCADFLGG